MDTKVPWTPYELAFLFHYYFLVFKPGHVARFYAWSEDLRRTSVRDLMIVKLGNTTTFLLDHSDGHVLDDYPPLVHTSAEWLKSTDSVTSGLSRLSCTD